MDLIRSKFAWTASSALVGAALVSGMAAPAAAAYAQQSSYKLASGKGYSTAGWHGKQAGDLALSAPAGTYSLSLPSGVSATVTVESDSGTNSCNVGGGSRPEITVPAAGRVSVSRTVNAAGGTVAASVTMTRVEEALAVPSQPSQAPAALSVADESADAGGAEDEIFDEEKSEIHYLGTGTYYTQGATASDKTEANTLQFKGDTFGLSTYAGYRVELRVYVDPGTGKYTKMQGRYTVTDADKKAIPIPDAARLVVVVYQQTLSGITASADEAAKFYVKKDMDDQGNTGEGDDGQGTEGDEHGQKGDDPGHNDPPGEGDEGDSDGKKEDGDDPTDRNPGGGGGSDDTPGSDQSKPDGTAVTGFVGTKTKTAGKSLDVWDIAAVKPLVFGNYINIELSYTTNGEADSVLVYRIPTELITSGYTIARVGMLAPQFTDTDGVQPQLYVSADGRTMKVFIPAHARDSREDKIFFALKSPTDSTIHSKQSIGRIDGYDADEDPLRETELPMLAWSGSRTTPKAFDYTYNIKNEMPGYIPNTQQENFTYTVAPEIADPTKNGRHVTGWYVDEALTVPYDPYEWSGGVATAVYGEWGSDSSSNRDYNDNPGGGTNPDTNGGGGNSNGNGGNSNSGGNNSGGSNSGNGGNNSSGGSGSNTSGTSGTSGGSSTSGTSGSSGSSGASGSSTASGTSSSGTGAGSGSVPVSAATGITVTSSTTPSTPDTGIVYTYVSDGAGATTSISTEGMSKTGDAGVAIGAMEALAGGGAAWFVIRKRRR